MKLLQINTVSGKGSTGKICVALSQLAYAAGIENKILYFSGHCNSPFSYRISSDLYKGIQKVFSKIFGNYGFNSFLATRKLIRNIKSFAPDVIHIHNIHGHDVNFSHLFNFLKKTHIKVVYTFHDCWAFTGYCPYYTYVNCFKWKKECNHCPLKKNYSWFFDKSKKNFQKKKNAFNGLDLVIVTPSRWLANDVMKSFLHTHLVQVINNGIDLSIFKPTDSAFRLNHHLENVYVVLGVADSWEKRKGIDVFVKLAQTLPNNYRVVLVGTDGRVDKTLPNSIISIHRTQNQMQLAELYSMADVFVNPTREDNYPTVNMEALACGTPVVTFATGGSPEMIDDTCGSVVECDNFSALISEIIRACESDCFTKEACLIKSRDFNMNNNFCEYINLYKRLFQEKKLAEQNDC